MLATRDRVSSSYRQGERDGGTERDERKAKVRDSETVRVREPGGERPGGKRRENREGEKCGRKRLRELERQS